MPAPSRVYFALIAPLLVSLAPAFASPLAIDDSDRVILHGNVPVRARPELEIGRSRADLPMARMILLLRKRPGGDGELQRLLAAQHDPSSPLFHRWLTPEEFGARFGLGDGEIATVAGWLRAQGFTIDEVAHGRGWIDFSGTAAQVERAFRVEMRDYLVDGRVRHANAGEPSLPRALAGLVHGVVALHSFESRPLLRVSRANANGGAGDHYLAPADFATIYDLVPAYTAGLNGGGQSIAIVARSDIQLSDVRSFRATFGLPANDPVFVHNGPDPGVVSGDEGEADLDTEWAGAVARSATIKLVISASTNSADGVDLSAQYIVDHNLAPVRSTSFGLCEAQMGSTDLAFYDSLWSQAAAQGITSLTSAGDSGAAGCDSPDATSGSGRAVSGICSSSNDVCVGGTQLDDTASPGSYWSASENPVTQGSALSYIPELVWNESGAAGGSGLWSTGGGASTVYAKPAWQSAPGVPSDGSRDVPDVALSAADHDGYLGFSAGHEVVFSGTSAAAPSFAGILALVVESTGSRQGNANTALYSMAARQYAGTGAAVFHDIRSGNNSVPGTTGFPAGSAYDRATGLGSVDAAALIQHWGTTLDTSPCVRDGGTACLLSSRFEIKVTYASTSNGSGSAQVMSFGGQRTENDQSVFYWFFDPSNFEMGLKVLDGCGVNGKFWVFISGLTDQQWTVDVRDSQTGAIKTYSNALGHLSQTTADTAALACP